MEATRRLRIPFSNITMHCIDHWKGIEGGATDIKNPYEIFMDNVKKADIDDVIKINNIDSNEGHKLYDDGFFDMVFVDGDHSLKGVINDIKNYLPKVKKGGILAGHDAGEKFVRKGLDECFEKDRYRFDMNQNIWIVQL